MAKQGKMADLSTRLQERLGESLRIDPAGRDLVTAETSAGDLLEVCRVLRNEQDLSFEQLSDLCGVDYATYGRGDWQTESTTYTGFSRGIDPEAHGFSEEFKDPGDAPPQEKALKEAPTSDLPPKDLPPKEMPNTLEKTTAENTTAAATAPHRGNEACLAVVYHLLSLKHNRRLRLRCRAVGEPPQLPSVVSIWNSANWYERESFDLFGILFTDHPDLRRLLTDYGFIGHPFRKDFPLHGKVEVRYDPAQERVVYQPVSIENRVLVPRVLRRDPRSQEDETPAPPSPPTAD